jgi:hypothetical protein
MSTFTTIAFGMCAYLASGFGPQHPTMVMIGNIDMGICEPFLFLPDSHGQRATLRGHEYGVDVTNTGAKLYFDQKVFTFVKDSI